MGEDRNGEAAGDRLMRIFERESQRTDAENRRAVNRALLQYLEAQEDEWPKHRSTAWIGFAVSVVGAGLATTLSGSPSDTSLAAVSVAVAVVALAGAVGVVIAAIRERRKRRAEAPLSMAKSTLRSEIDEYLNHAASVDDRSKLEWRSR